MEGYVRIFPNAPLGKRFVAFAVDSAVSLLLFTPAAILLAFGFSHPLDYEVESSSVDLLCEISALTLIPLSYQLFKDGIGKGRSIGKKLAGLVTVNTNGNKPCDFKTSLKRNVIFIVPVIGLLLEAILILVFDDGLRTGDKIASTKVTETKFFSGQNE